MNKMVRGLLVLAGVVLSGLTACHAQDDKTENPKFKFWANFKPGATSTYQETTKFYGPEKASLPGGVAQKTIVYRLQSASKDKAVVVTTVVEEDFLSTVESSPTKITFPAMVKKAALEAILQEWLAKEGADETITVAGKEIKCKVRSGTSKIEGGTIEFKICYSDTVPGGIVHRTRTTKEGNTTVAETTTTLKSFAEGKPGKPKDKK